MFPPAAASFPWIVIASDSRGPHAGSLSQLVANWCNRYSVVVFAILSAWLFALTWNYGHRPLWFDELSTYYIAQQPTVARMLEAIRTIDLNPPLNYFLTRWAISAFGASPWVARLPGLLAFWVGSYAIFALLRRRSSALIAALGVLLFFSNPFFPYASEARPYGLLLGLSALLLAGWDEAVNGNRVLGSTVVFLAATLLLLSHIFGALTLGAVWIGECVRSLRRRRVDGLLVAAMFLPLLATFTWRPMFHTIQGVTFPPESQATWGKLYFLYYGVFRWMIRPLLVLVIVIFVARSRERGSEETETPGLPTILTLLFLIPVGLVLLFMRTHGAFYDRYAMAMVLPVVLVAPLLLWRATAASHSASLSAVLLVALSLLLSTSLRGPLVYAADKVLPPGAAQRTTKLLTTSVHGPFRPWWKPLPVPDALLRERAQAPLLPSLDSFHPDLPIVAANELTFVEMDNRESDALTHRLYYLYDRQAELEFAHRTATGTMLHVRNFFPLRATIAPYNEFIHQRRQFLVVGTYEHPGDWLLRKLEADGAQLEIVGKVTGYADTDVYLATLPAQ